MRYLLLLFSIFLAVPSFSQVPDGKSSSEIYQQIKKLKVLGSVLYVAAHPDDENTYLITWLGNEKLYRTAYLSMTRGDGGQNLIGNEQGVELGLIRTNELLAARSIDGGEQFFTRAFDFGYSKGPEETFNFWNKEKILSDVVWVIRKFQPDVIVTRFPTTGEGGHGHHTASAILAGEAFDAAADPNRFPEQLKYGVTTWQPKRLLWNTFNFGRGLNTTSEDQFRLDAGGYNVLLGKSFGELAAQSRSQHKSQGFGMSPSRGPHNEYFKLIKGDAPTSGLLDGVNTSWSRIGAAHIEKLIDRLEKEYTFLHPEKSVPLLLKIYDAIERLPVGVWRDKKLNEVKDLIAACSGLFTDAYTSTQFLVPGKEVKIRVVANNRSDVSVNLKNITFRGQTMVSGSEALKSGENIEKNISYTLPDTMQASQPYWLQQPMTEGSFNVNHQLLIGKPRNDPMSISMDLDFGGTVINYSIPVWYRYNDPVKGEVHQPVFVVPSVEVKSTPSVALSLNMMPVSIHTQVTPNDSDLTVSQVKLNADPSVRKAGDNGTAQFSDSKENSVEKLGFYVTSGDKSFDRYKVSINYPHISDIVYFPEAQSKLVSVNLKTNGKEAGFIAGAGDKIPEALIQMGYNVTMLDEEDVKNKDLSAFDVILTGVRAYNVHSWLNDLHDKLMQYVNNGGVFFVQYNTNSNLGPVKAKIGPYPFNISRTRVTDEKAAVGFTDKTARLLNYPNSITQEDFKGWIQERSIYQASDFSENYKSLFAMNDEGEAPSDGSLIYCDYGKGRFVYSGLVFFRELPAGVPGAYRLFANLIANPNK
ncbi:MAG: PIG-L family deacetylase [Chitinophagaceae bacterium]|nr:PIG-L family deacetylase [Chitinophagaceae bacterium]